MQYETKTQEERGRKKQKPVYPSQNEIRDKWGRWYNTQKNTKQKPITYP